ncbi:MAG: hypothetical protein IJS25_01105 [Bacteroidales bacterium]|nr:hypothetical protein [Bacteroidales bacterium]
MTTKTLLANMMLAAALILSACTKDISGLERDFLTPPEEAKPIMIWQWMDGLVSKEGITADLEAYKAAGIGGVQQFLVGGTVQLLVKDTTNAIGTDNWRALMKHAIDECKRLGLSFGTHNCPGWSSSAFPTVQPEYSMQKVVWSETAATGNGKPQRLSLPQPEVDPEWNFYRDIAVLAVHGDGAEIDSVIVVDAPLDNDGTLSWTVPNGSWNLMRFGHTTNGKTNYATAPEGGVGLECDKMRREAVLHFWQQYPQQIIDIAGEETGKTFKRFEIDSYEAGGQEWTEAMPQEFQQRRGYDIRPWLPVIAGMTMKNKASAAKFTRDWQTTVRELFAENYYGYMSELAHAHGLQFVMEPYGTGSAKPFNPISTDWILSHLDKSDIIAAEFWTKPESWGWPEVPGIVAAARKAGWQKVYAEGFTCWQGYAWKDDPSGLKVIGDKAFCLGINGFMLHAGAQNPWTNVKPGMTFGVWGTQWTPGQTWWKDGAPELFAYFNRCQALLQRGLYVDDYKSAEKSLTTDQSAVQWIHRQEGDTDWYFIANTSEETLTPMLTFETEGRVPEIWDPQSLEMAEAASWYTRDGQTFVQPSMAPRRSLFIVLRRPAKSAGPGIAPVPEQKMVTTIDGPWTVTFPEGWGAPAETTMEQLTSWAESEDNGIKYFSGTATYSNTFNIGNLQRGAKYVLTLGRVKNMAVVRVNGAKVETLWTPPFETDITDYLHKGENKLEIEVTNLWVNRLVGDEFEPEDIEWTEPSGRGGRFMLKVPEWLAKGLPRPSQNRKTVVIYNFFTKNEPLLESGLLGPVTVSERGK